MKALTFSTFGTTEVLNYSDIPQPTISAGEVLIEMKAIGINFADIYRRKGNYYLQGTPPYINGNEGAGIVKYSHSKKFKIGDRVGFADVPFSNAEFVKASENNVIKLPKEISFSMASSILLQGLTAQYLASESYKVKKDDTVLIHAAAGGVGQLLTQICKLKKAQVIGLTRSIQKTEIILKKGSNYAIILDENWKKRVLEITNNNGVDVSYDSIGSTLMDSFEVTKNKGNVVFYGMSDANPPLIDPMYLMNTGKTLTGGDLGCYLNSFEERKQRANQLFNWIINKEIIVTPPKEFSLSDGHLAHQYLESGKSSGKIILIP